MTSLPLILKELNASTVKDSAQDVWSVQLLEMNLFIVPHVWKILKFQTISIPVSLKTAIIMMFGTEKPMIN